MDPKLKKILEVDSNDSDAVKEALSSFMQNLTKHVSVDCNIWLKTLEFVINRFPKYLLSYRRIIESYLINYLDTTNFYNVIEAAKCSNSLQQVRLIQDNKATPKACWKEQMNMLLQAAHKLCTSIFTHTLKQYGYDKRDKQRYQPQHLANCVFTGALVNITTVQNIAEKYMKSNRELLVIRLRNIFVFIQAMLLEPFPVPKPISPQAILNLIVHALNMSSGMNGNSNIDVVDIKTQGLRTIDALVACLGSNLIPFSPVIIKLVMATLKWSSEKPNSDRRSVTCVAYNTLKQWLTILHTHRVHGREKWDDELTNYIVKDITPVTRVVQLTMNTMPTKKLSKKAKRKLTSNLLASHTFGDNSKDTECDEINDEVPIAALQCAETFLTVCGIFLKPAMHKLLQENLIRECYTLHNYTEERALLLLQALEAARKTTPYNVPPPTQYCLQLYSMLTNSGDERISKFCSEALLNIRLHLHCSPPTINFALEVPEEELKKREKRIFSERNRDVLESLLGTDRMPQVIEDDSSDADSEKEEGLKSVIIEIIDDEPPREEAHVQEVDDTINNSPDEEDVESFSESLYSKKTQYPTINIENKISHESLKRAHCEEIDNGFSNKKLCLCEDIDNITDKVSVSSESNKSVELRYDTGKEDSNIEFEVIEEQSIRKILNTSSEIEETNIENEQEEEMQDINKPQEKIGKVYEAVTQIPLNVSNDTIEGGVSQKSTEITYDFPNSDRRITVTIDTLDEDIPSSTETDDIQITCGQIVKESHDNENNNLDEALKVSDHKSDNDNDVRDAAIETANKSQEIEKLTSETDLTSNDIDSEPQITSETEVNVQEIDSDVAKVNGGDNMEGAIVKKIQESKKIDIVEVPKVNGDGKAYVESDIVNVKDSAENVEMSVEDMLSDFVDEVVKDTTQTDA